MRRILLLILLISLSKSVNLAGPIDRSIIIASSVWRHHRLGKIDRRMAVTPRYLILNRDDITVECYDVYTGSEKWRWAAPAKLRWPQFHEEDASYKILCGWSFLFVTTTDGTLRAIDLDSGNEQWQFKPTAPITTPPVATTNTLFVQSAEGKIHAVDGRTGKKMWSARTKNRPVTPLFASGSLLLFGTAPAHIYAVSAETGHKRWKRRLSSGTPRYAPVVAPGRFAWPSSSGALHIIERANGKTVSLIDMKAPPLPGATIVGTRILLSTQTGYLLSADLMTGKEKWRQRIHKKRTRSLFTRTAQLFNFRAAGDIVAVVSLDDHRLVCLSSKDGKIMWTQPVAGDFSLPPLLWGEKLFCGGEKRSLVCYDRSGKKVWHTRSRSPLVTAPIVDSQGVIYFATSDGFLQAVRVEPFLE